MNIEEELRPDAEAAKIVTDEVSKVKFVFLSIIPQFL